VHLKTWSSRGRTSSFSRNSTFLTEATWKLLSFCPGPTVREVDGPHRTGPEFHSYQGQAGPGPWHPVYFHDSAQADS